MAASKIPADRKRSYLETHRDLIVSAVKIISQHGSTGLTFALLARELNIDRTTIYYHFKSKDELLKEVRIWSANELAKGFSLVGSPQERIRYTVRYALENPELTKLWIQDLMDPSIDIQQIYPMWDDVVSGIAAQAEAQMPRVRAEIFFLNMLVASVLSPTTFSQKLARGETADEVVNLFENELLRLFTLSGIGPAG